LSTPIEEGTRKYKQRMDWLVQRIKLRPRQETINENQAVAQGKLGFFDDKVKALLNREGVWLDMYQMYLSYARALDKSQRELNFMVDLIREHQILRDRFQRRGLDPAVLTAIDALVIYRTADA
jgi:hypothetical protein